MPNAIKSTGVVKKSVDRHFEGIQKSLSKNGESDFYRDETADEILKLPSELLNMTTVLLPRFICKKVLLSPSLRVAHISH